MTTEQAMEMARVKMGASNVGLVRIWSKTTITVIMAFPDGDTASRFANHMVSIDHDKKTIRIVGH